MDLQKLRYFISVAENLSFTAASKELFVSQTSVSKQIANFEAELGVKLFIRDRRSVKLTIAGEVLLEEANNVLNSYNKAIEKTINAASGLKGQIKIGFLGPVEEEYLPHMLNSFHAKYPHINVSLNQYYLGPLMNEFNKGKLDIAFTLSTVVQDDFTVIYEKLYGENFSVVCNEQEWFAFYEQIELSALANEKFIFLNKKQSLQTYDLIIDSCLSNGLKPEIIDEPNSYEHITMLVKTGKGISIIPTSIKGYYGTKGLRFIPIAGNPIKYDVVIAWKKDNINPYNQLFKENLIQSLKAHKTQKNKAK